MKWRSISVLVFFFILFLTGGKAQTVKPIGAGHEAASELSGVLRYDLIPAQSISSGPLNVRMEIETVRSEKSPLRAALFSAVLPGSGQFYAESYVGAAAFGAAEVGLWIVFAIFDGKGTRQTDEYETYANSNWSVVRYAEWIERHGIVLNPDAVILQGTVISQNPNLSPWNRVDWAKLNSNEEAIGKKTGTGFSHRLPRWPDQQYYEVIGKYEQYTSGWADSNVGTHDYLTNVSPQFRFYRDMRGRANDLFMVASTAAGILVANHVFSALHAAWSAHKFNKNLNVDVQLRPIDRQFGWAEYVPTATLTVNF